MPPSVVITMGRNMRSSGASAVACFFDFQVPFSKKMVRASMLASFWYAGRSGQHMVRSKPMMLGVK